MSGGPSPWPNNVAARLHGAGLHADGGEIASAASAAPRAFPLSSLLPRNHCCSHTGSVSFVSSKALLGTRSAGAARASGQRVWPCGARAGTPGSLSAWWPPAGRAPELSENAAARSRARLNRLGPERQAFCQLQWATVRGSCVARVPRGEGTSAVADSRTWCAATPTPGSPSAKHQAGAQGRHLGQHCPAVCR